MIRIFAIAAAFIAASAAYAQDSPQFRGENGVGISKAKNLPTQWSESQNVRWKSKLPGRGLSCPVVAGGRVYVTACTGFEQKRLHILCFDEKTGKQLWERQLWATGTTGCHNKTNMAAPTPVTDGKRVFALFATFDLVALDNDGNLLWYRSLTGDYPDIGNNVGAAASPVLWKNVLLVAMENAGNSFALGVDSQTGKNIWKVKRYQRVNWTTPIVYDNNGQTEVAFQSINDITGYDPATGKKRWSLTGDSFSAIVTPVYNKGLIFAAGGPKVFAVRPSTKKTETEIVWDGKISTGYSSPLVYNGIVYGLSSRGVLTGADAKSGKRLFQLRVQGTYASSPLLADGRIYVINEAGATTVITPGEKAKILGVNELSPGAFLASPVAANNALFLRSDDYLYCVGKD